MKNTTFTIIILAVAIGSVLLTRSCYRPEEPKAKIITKTVIEYKDTGSHTIKVEKPEVKIEYDTHIVWKEKPIDTLKILSDYHKSRNYDSTIVDDSSMYIAYRANVFRNRLQQIDVEYKNRRPTKISTTEIHLPHKRNEIYLGIEASGGEETMDIFGTAELVRDKFKYGIGYAPMTKKGKIGLSLRIWRK